MKRLIAVALAVALVITLFAVVGPVSAGKPDNPAVYETNIVPGPWDPDEVDPLDKGEVKVCSDGTMEIEIEGAPANRTYKVYVGEWAGGSTVEWSSPGWLTTDENGEGSFTFTLATDTYRPLFALNYPPYADDYGHANVFISGFEITSP